MSHYIKAGLLREVISIQRYVTSPSSYGEPVKSWSTLSSNVRASVKPVNMNESFQDDQFISTENKTFFMRYTTNINVKDRIAYRSQFYNVESIINADERNHRLEVTARKVNPGT